MQSDFRRRWLRAGFGGLAYGLGLVALAGSLSAFGQTSTNRPVKAAVPVQTAVLRSMGSGPTRIAVLLETQSPSFGKASAAVIAGIKSAHARDGQGIIVDIISVSDTGEDVDQLVNALPARGYTFVIGPLTRNGANALADRGALPIPVLVLNQPDSDRRVSNNLIIFGLPVESEGRQVARAAFDDAALRIPDRRPLKALIVSNTTPIGRRSFAAFSDAWRELGGTLVEPVETDGRTGLELRSAIGAASGDVAFAAVGPDALRALRATLPKELRLYATSQANSLQPGITLKMPELDGVRLVDMPWQLQPDHTAVMAYAKAPTLTHLDFQRLYALGIDSFRLARELLGNRQQFELDGVTGRLKVDLPADSRVDRTSVLAEYRNGVITPIEPR
jgi:uncharacterized protein